MKRLNLNKETLSTIYDQEQSGIHAAGKNAAGTNTSAITSPRHCALTIDPCYPTLEVYCGPTEPFGTCVSDVFYCPR